MQAMQDRIMTDRAVTKPFLKALTGGVPERVPVWLMRQAGRYLPEYRDLRAQAGGFLNMVFDPVKAAEVTIQPLRRFGMDAAILFSDILVVPQALGQGVRFETGEGPVLDAITDAGGIDRLNRDRFDEILSPVYETVRLVRRALTAEGFSGTALIGFAGAPWTVACYMVEGGGSRDFNAVRRWALADPKNFSRLIGLLTESTISYLRAQIDAGAEAVQLFDSWAGILDRQEFARWVIAPARTIARALKQSHPHVPLIGFPRGAGPLYLDYAAQAEVSALGLDQQVPPGWAAKNLQMLLPVQGNLDPARLLAGGDALRAGAEDILRSLAGRPFVFNLGHGVIKETPPDHVRQLVEMVQSWKA